MKNANIFYFLACSLLLWVVPGESFATAVDFDRSLWSAEAACPGAGREPSAINMAVEHHGSLVVFKAGACIARSVSEVWAVTLNHQAHKPARVEEVNIEVLPPPDDLISQFFRVSYVAANTLRMVQWTADWTYRPDDLDPEKVTRVDLEYKKTSGSWLMKTFEGNVRLVKLGPQMTALSKLDVLDVTGMDDRDVRAGFELFVEQMRTSPPLWAALSKACTSTFCPLSAQRH